MNHVHSASHMGNASMFFKLIQLKHCFQVVKLPCMELDDQLKVIEN